ncbi:MAG: glycosyltransferase family 4 protein [Rhodobiaceae bacterium]|nr:glycosyltransferase family 4 protein [Rhodobiaceae bacterium]MCC0060973.1 glycosyltransferase family 4 protein [Rhodobiaceae bacterium]
MKEDSDDVSASNDPPSPDRIEVLVPNFKQRLSGVTSTIVRLVPLQAGMIGIASVGPGLPQSLPHISLWSLLMLPRTRPGGGARVWHARRNTEMVGGLILKYLLGKRLKLLFTSASQRHHKWFTKWLIRRMDALISTSSRTAGYLDHPSDVILHGIDTERFSPIPVEERGNLRERLGLPRDGLLVGCYGRIRAQKGTDVFVDAMLELSSTRPELAAIVLGRATEKHRGFENDLRAKVRAAGVAERFFFPPEVPVSEMADWYRVLDLFIAPQRWEGFGLTPLEAMSCGVPVVATTVGAFPELVADGVTGALVPAGDAAAMAQASAELLDDPARMTAASRAARERVLSGFRIEGEARRLVDLYRKLLKND